MYIGISGKMGSGKDYIIENYLKPYIETKLNKKCLILSFADMIKINLMVHNNIQLNELYGKKTNTIRKLLQIQGTEKGRNVFGEDIWIKYVKSFAELHMSRGIDIILIPDVRFINEYNFIKNNGIVIRIEAPNRNEKRLQEESTNIEEYNKIKNHISENELNDFNFDIIINNDNIINRDDIYNILDNLSWDTIKS
jgi:phosphomevalonate kinase